MWVAGSGAPETNTLAGMASLASHFPNVVATNTELLAKQLSDVELCCQSFQNYTPFPRLIP